MNAFTWSRVGGLLVNIEQHHQLLLLGLLLVGGVIWWDKPTRNLRRLLRDITHLITAARSNRCTKRCCRTRPKSKG